MCPSPLGLCVEPGWRHKGKTDPRSKQNQWRRNARQEVKKEERDSGHQKGKGQRWGPKDPRVSDCVGSECWPGASVGLCCLLVGACVVCCSGPLCSRIRAQDTSERMTCSNVFRGFYYAVPLRQHLFILTRISGGAWLWLQWWTLQALSNRSLGEGWHFKGGSTWATSQSRPL